MLYKQTTYYEKEYRNPITEYQPNLSNFSLEINSFDDLRIDLDFVIDIDASGRTVLELQIPDYDNLCRG